MTKTSFIRAHGRRNFGALAVAGLAGLVVSTAASAQSGTLDENDDSFQVAAAGTQGGEIIDVTGRVRRAESLKRTAPVEDMPQSISVIPSEVFTQQGARNLTDILRNTPGITFSAGENGFGTGLANFGMRGFDTSGSIFVDGVRDSGSYNRDSFNVELIEVVKGPAGDNGRGTAGGYVNIVSKTPFLGEASGGVVSYGFDETDADGRVRLTADVNSAIGAGSAIRLNALWEDGGVAGRAVAQRQSVGIAPSIAFGLDTPTRVFLSAQYVEQNDLPDWGIPAALIDGMLRYDPTLPGRDLRDAFYGLSSDYDDVTATSVLARLEHTVRPGLEVSTQLRWAETDRNAEWTMPLTYVAATGLLTTQRQYYARENTSLASLSNVTAEFESGSLKHTLSAGFEVTWDESTASSFPTQNNPGTGAPISVLNPDPNRAGPGRAAATQLSDVTVRTIGAYVFDTIEFSPQWQLTGGLRVESYDVEIGNRTADGAPLRQDGFDLSDTTVSGRVGIVYKPVENATLYAAAGIAALPPASFLSNPDISREGDNAFPGFSAGMNSADAKTQESINYELGVKWELFDERLLATAALFRTEKRNVAITGIDPTVTPAPSVALLGYGEQIVQGVELSVAGTITPEWQVFGGLLLMESKREHSAFLDAARRLANPGDYGAVLRTSGDELALTPNVSANLWTTYSFPFGLTVGGGMQYVGSSWVGRPDDAERIIPNGNAGELPSYWTINAMLEYDITPDVAVRLNIDNLTDEFYAVSTNWPAQRVTLGPPRSFLLSLSVDL